MPRLNVGVVNKPFRHYSAYNNSVLIVGIMKDEKLRLKTQHLARIDCSFTQIPGEVDLV